MVSKAVSIIIGLRTHRKGLSNVSSDYSAEDMDEDENKQRDFDDYPPKLASNVGFWLWHGFCWTFYGLVTLIYLPWALAMHVVLVAAAIPFCIVCCWRYGRQFFLYAYVITVMLPGKFLWFNLFRRNLRRRRVWDFEMGKPRAIPLQDRRRLSVSENIKPQPSSQLLTKLPPEVRLLIYKHVIVGESGWLNMFEGELVPAKSITKRSNFKTTAFPFLLDPMAMEDERMQGIIGPLHRLRGVNYNTTSLSMGLSLLQTCRQVYCEGIDLLYSQPTFSFRDLHKPPFFLRSALPHRLASVRSIHLVYDQVQMVKGQHVACSTAKYHHRVGECTFCNPVEWLTRIKTYMTNLKSIEIFIFLDREMNMLSMGENWIARLFELQIGPNGLRQMKIHLSPQEEDEFGLSPSTEVDFAKKVKRLNESLQQRLKKGIERHAASQTTVEASPAAQPPHPPVHAKEPEDVKELPLDVP